MVEIISLWIPILLSGVFVFLVSAIIHAVLPYHRTDFRKMPFEDEVMAALRRFEIPPGEYEVPYASSSKERGTPEFVEKATRGPAALVTIASGPPSMSKLLIYWFLYSVIVSVFAAYIAGRALPPGASFMSVFRFAGSTAFAAYALALWQDSIWYGREWSTTLKSTFDGLIYAVLTGVIFGWLWPD